MRARVRSLGIVVVVALLLTGCGARFDKNASAGAGDQGLSGGAPAGPTTTAAAKPDESGPVAPGPAPGVTADSIKIGYLLPLTGAAPIPSNFDKGVKVYWNYVNRQGGIFGRKVEVVVEDTQSSASVGKDKAKKLVEEDKVFTVVVLDRLENQQAIGAYLDARKVPNIEIQTPANLAKSQTWTFGVTIDHAVQGRLIADYFVHVLRAEKVGVIYENAPALSPGRNAFATEIGKLKAKVAYNRAIDPQANDFSNEALGLKQAGATAVWLYMAPTLAAKLANQADAAGYHPTWFANSISWGFDLVLKVAPAGLAGARVQPVAPAGRPAHRHLPARVPEPVRRGARRPRPGRLGRRPDRGQGLERAGKDLGQNGFRNAMQHLKFAPDLWAPVSFRPGVREGANVVAVLKQDGDHWALERDFAGSF